MLGSDSHCQHLVWPGILILLINWALRCFGHPGTPLSFFRPPHLASLAQCASSPPATVRTVAFLTTLRLRHLGRSVARAASGVFTLISTLTLYRYTTYTYVSSPLHRPTQVSVVSRLVPRDASGLGRPYSRYISSSHLSFVLSSGSFTLAAPHSLLSSCLCSLFNALAHIIS
ncbi:hypothetical protein V8D89_013609 [Ganoderma adspersum]